MGRFALVFVFGGLAGAAGMAAVHHDAETKIRPVATYQMVEKIDGQETTASIVELTLDPGAAGEPHRHPGPVFGIILEGSYDWAIDEQPAKTLKPGEVFYEPTGVLHRVSRNPSKQEKARVMAIVLHSRDVHELAVPEKAKQE